MLSTANLTMQFGAQPLFENISAKFEQGGRYGLIGANGVGKSTFLKILSGHLKPTYGQVNTTPNDRMSSLNQDQFAFESFSVMDTVIMGHQELWSIKQEKDALYALPNLSEEQGMKAAELEMHYAELDGYAAEAKAAELLLDIGIGDSMHFHLMSELAPALKLRVLLTQVLFSDPDIMLLDEPTNHLDIHTIRWLEGILSKKKCTMIIVSHDRHFLNTVCSHIADLDYGQLNLFYGNYDEYMVAATQARQRVLTDNARKEQKIQQLQSFVRRFSANASKSRQATSRLKQIDKIQLQKVKPSSRRFPYIQFSQGKNLHRLVCEIHCLANGYNPETPLFKSVNLHLEAKERIAIIGTNGIGKTTFIKTLMHCMKPQKGWVKWSEHAVIGYLPQDHSQEFQQNLSLWDWVAQFRQASDDDTALRSVLGRMLFSADDIHKSVQVTSGGEKVRLMLAKIALQRPNILILDEPTNHLDMESIEALNMGLEDYEGTLLFVSHDRQFVSSLATQMIEIKSNEVCHYRGGYEDYLHSQGL